MAMVVRIDRCDYNMAARRERRRRRLERRSLRLEKVARIYSETIVSDSPAQVHEVNESPLYGLSKETDAANIATFSSQELYQHALRRAVSDGLYGPEEVESFDPRVLLTLPRLTLFYGMHESDYPVEAMQRAESSAPSRQRGDTPEVLLDAFLPRLCRALPPSIVITVRSLSSSERAKVARRLSVFTVDDEPTDHDVDNVDVKMDTIFTTISKQADASRRENLGKHNKLMKKVLNDFAHDGVAAPVNTGEDEQTIARAYLAILGLG